MGGRLAHMGAGKALIVVVGGKEFSLVFFYQN